MTSVDDGGHDGEDNNNNNSGRLKYTYLVILVGNKDMLCHCHDVGTRTSWGCITRGACVIIIKKEALVWRRQILQRVGSLERVHDFVTKEKRMDKKGLAVEK